MLFWIAAVLNHPKIASNFVLYGSNVSTEVFDDNVRESQQVTEGVVGRCTVK